MNNVCFLNFIHFLLIPFEGISQGITFQKPSLDRALSEASQAEKPIFIGVYTHWCGPCKRMDNSVFIDNSIDSNFNDSFKSLKANAEDQKFGTLIARRYEVSGYPISLFVSNNGELIMKPVGLQSKSELMDRASEAMTLYNSLDYLKSVKSNIYGDYSMEELKVILHLSHKHPFEGRDQLSLRYMDMIEAI